MIGFIEFLHRKGVLYAFFINFDADDWKDQPFDYDSYLMRDHFEWSSSPQGYDFWNSLDDEWEELFCEIQSAIKARFK